MLKYALLAGAMIVSTPALAQTTPAPDQATPTTDATAPVAPQTAPAPTAQPAPAAPMAAQPQAAPAPSAQAAAPAPADPATASAQPAPANSGDQVATVVGKEFPTYDKDANGSLSKTEFTAWMLALKSASDPSVKPEDPKTKTWMTQAFTQADTDKSKSVSKDELTNFLSQASGSKAS